MEGIRMNVLAATASPARAIPFLLIALVFGFAAYRSSEAFNKKRGTTPWRLPSWAWAMIGFLSLLLCAVLFLIASRTTKVGPEPHRSVAPPEAGWYPDPKMEHQFRYWDGAEWTSRVEDAGVERNESVSP
jgi:amino acid transporter